MAGGVGALLPSRRSRRAWRRRSNWVRSHPGRGPGARAGGGPAGGRPLLLGAGGGPATPRCSNAWRGGPEKYAGRHRRNDPASYVRINRLGMRSARGLPIESMLKERARILAVAIFSLDLALVSAAFLCAYWLRDSVLPAAGAARPSPAASTRCRATCRCCRWRSPSGAACCCAPGATARTAPCRCSTRRGRSSASAPAARSSSPSPSTSAGWTSSCWATTGSAASGSLLFARLLLPLPAHREAGAAADLALRPARTASTTARC